MRLFEIYFMNYSLNEHLKRYGIYEKNEEKYWAWVGGKLGMLERNI